MVASAELNLGADQYGELHAKVMPHLTTGETYIVEERPGGEQDALILAVIGSRGTYLMAHMTDKGWEISTEFYGQGKGDFA